MLKKLRRMVLQFKFRVLASWYAQYRRYKRFAERLTVEQELKYWRSQELAVLRAGKNGYRLRIRQLGLTPEDLARLEAQAGQEVVIADIDKNGLWLSYVGPIQHAPTVTQDRYLARRRFQVQVVARDGYIGVRKSYRGSKINFVRELKILHYLGAADCHVPAILDVDFEHLTLTTSYIAGRVLKDELAARGAQLFSQKLGSAQGPRASARGQIRSRRAQEGRRVLSQVLGQPIIEKLYQELCEIHAAGVLDVDVQYGNIIIEKQTKQPYWIDFEHATFYPKLSQRAFNFLRTANIAKFNSLFGTDKRITTDELPSDNQVLI